MVAAANRKYVCKVEVFALGIAKIFQCFAVRFYRFGVNKSLKNATSICNQNVLISKLF